MTRPRGKKNGRIRTVENIQIESIGYMHTKMEIKHKELKMNWNKNGVNCREPSLHECPRFGYRFGNWALVRHWADNIAGQDLRLVCVHKRLYGTSLIKLHGSSKSQREVHAATHLSWIQIRKKKKNQNKIYKKSIALFFQPFRTTMEFPFKIDPLIKKTFKSKPVDSLVKSLWSSDG